MSHCLANRGVMWHCLAKTRAMWHCLAKARAMPHCFVGVGSWVNLRGCGVVLVDMGETTPVVSLCAPRPPYCDSPVRRTVCRPLAKSWYGRLLVGFGVVLRLEGVWPGVDQALA
jgi:hypothetical protein